MGWAPTTNQNMNSFATAIPMDLRRAARPSVRNPSVWPQQATGATLIGLEVVQLPQEMDRNMWV